jgi:hypothetical protein
VVHVLIQSRRRISASRHLFGAAPSVFAHVVEKDSPWADRAKVTKELRHHRHRHGHGRVPPVGAAKH